MQLRIIFILLFFQSSFYYTQIINVSSTAGFSRSKEFLSIEDYIILVGDKKLLNYELLDYTKTSRYRMTFNLTLGIDIFKTNLKMQKFHPIYHISYSFIPGSLVASYRKDEIQTSSFSTSTDPSMTYQYGILLRDNARSHLDYFQMFIENGVSFKMRPEKRISFDYGALFLIGNTKMKGSYVFHEMDSINYKKFEIEGESYFENEIIGSYYENPDYYPVEISNVSMGFTFPMGIDFRLGKNPQKFGRYHLLFTCRPSFVFTYLMDTKKIKYSYISNFSLLSLKFDIVKKEKNAK